MHHSTLSVDGILSCISYASRGKFILFLGACGTGMSALCRLLFHQGVSVRCFDDSMGGEYTTLVCESIPFLSDVNAPLRDCALIVYSLAVPEEHPLVQNEIPKCSRAQLLGALMREYPCRIAVAGSHGKSTVTALIHRLLMLSGKDPTTLSGASLGEGEGTLHIGGKEYFLYECCEYRDSFLYTAPTHAVLLNLELDHTDYFPDIEAIKASFLRFSNLADTVLYASFDQRLRELMPKCHARCLSLGFGSEASALSDDFTGVIKERRNGRYSFDFFVKEDETSAYIEAEIPGRVGAINTAFALAMTTIIGISIQETTKYSKQLTSISRRMMKIGVLNGHAVYYDFAHHPTEIRATIEALGEMYGAPPCVVFAPHTFSRTRDFLGAFADALMLCQRVYLCPIYAAREQPIEGISSQALAVAIGAKASLTASLSDLSALCEGGAIVLMGAGDLNEIKERIERDPAFVREKEGI